MHKLPLGTGYWGAWCHVGPVGRPERDGCGAGSRGACGGAAAAHRPLPGHHGAGLLARGPGARPRRVRALLPLLPVRRRLRPGRGAARLRALPAHLPPAGRRYPTAPRPRQGPRQPDTTPPFPRPNEPSPPRAPYGRALAPAHAGLCRPQTCSSWPRCCPQTLTPRSSSTSGLWTAPG